MRILQVIQGRDFEIQDVPIPEPGPGEVRLRVDAVAICAQWDLHLRRNDPMFVGHSFFYPYTPGQPGHEASGVVDQVGEGVVDLIPGQRASVWRDPGHRVQGAYAEYVVRPEGDVIAVPEHLSAEAAAPLELAMCVACAVLRMKSMGVIVGARLAVMGLGPAGLIAVQMLVAEGARHVLGLDLDEGRRVLALSLGAHETADPRTVEAELMEKRRLDSAIDCVGAKATVEYLLDRVGDTVQLFGVQREAYAYEPRHFFGGVRLSGYPRHNRDAAEYAVRLLERGKLDLGALVSHTLPLEQYALAIDLLEQQKAVKICLLPSLRFDAPNNARTRAQE